MHAWLEAEDGRRFAINNGNCSIGRLPGNTITLDDRQISRHHALIVTLAGNDFWLVDFGSRNGTRLNGNPVLEPRPLKSGDRIEIGAHKLLFHGRPDNQPAPRQAVWEETEKKGAAAVSVAQGVIVLDAAGTVLMASPRARRWLAIYFHNPVAQDTALPAELSLWLRHQSDRPGCRSTLRRRGDPLVRDHGSKRLRIQLAETDAEQQVLLFSEESHSDVRTHFTQLGLSKRESQVMFWLNEGKTNAEIATILSISSRTVEKQVSSILAKLGVENRAAAIVCAREFRAISP